MDIDEFATDFFQEIVSFSEAGEFMESSFTEVFASHLVDAGEFDTFDTAYYRAAKGMRVDGYAGDPSEHDGVLTLVVSDFSGDEAIQSLTKTQIEAVFRRLVNFYEASLADDFYVRMEESSAGYGLAQLINARKSSTNRVRLFLLSNKVLSDRVVGMDNTTVGGKPASYSVWDLSRLHRLIASKKGKEDIEIDLLAEFGEGLNCLPAHVGGDTYASYLSVVSGEMLSALYDRWGSRLLEQNVRCFLQARGKVNKGIRNTILNDPRMFFAYNNGITATAESVEVFEEDGAVKISKLKNFQIVNGGQTTASIFTASKKDKADLKQIFVQMKLSVVDPDRAEKIVPRISEYANSQNRVNAADFFANHPFHVRMEEFSRRIWARSPDGTFRDTKWFYERARGQYLDAKAYLSRAEKKRFDAEHPKAQSFTKTDLAKFENVWEQIPHIVSKGAQANFADFARRIGSKWDKDPDQFNEAYFRHAMARALIFRRMEKLVSAQSWYDGGYRANIVAYALSKLSDLVGATGKTINFEQIWDEQAVSETLEETMVNVAKVVHTAILDTPEGIRNISEWAKKEACWKRVKEIEFRLTESFQRELVSASKMKAIKNRARQTQRIDNGIEAQARVCELGPQFWSDCVSWARSNGALSEKDHQIMAIAAAIPNRIPTEKQSIHLTQLIEKLGEEACPHVSALD